jgi:hypothetical protein
MVLSAVRMEVMRTGPLSSSTISCAQNSSSGAASISVGVAFIPMLIENLTTTLSKRLVQRQTTSEADALPTRRALVSTAVTSRGKSCWMTSPTETSSPGAISILTRSEEPFQLITVGTRRGLVSATLAPWTREHAVHSTVASTRIASPLE